MKRKIVFRTLAVLAVTTCVAGAIGLFDSEAAKGSVSISVAAGSFDRRETVVTFDLPANFKGTSYGLRDEKGRVLPLQVDAQRRATFILPELAAGKTKTYRLINVKPERGGAARAWNWFARRTC